MNDAPNPIRDKSLAYSCKVVDAYQGLVRKREFILSKQFLSSGTSIGANVEEAHQAHSRADFIAKMQIALKEAYENRYWVRVLSHGKYIEKTQSSDLLSSIHELIKILVVIVARSRNNQNK